MANTNGSAADAATQPEEEKLSYLQKIWRYRKYLLIEPFLFFYMMGSVFNIVAMVNFPLEKACRVNLGYNDLVCRTTLEKDELGINCDDFSFENNTMAPGATPEEFNISISSMGFNYTVCKAEVEAQKLNADVAGKRAPIAAIFQLIVLVFAGSWSDRYNKRKPCMIFPIVGEAISFTFLLVSAVFFESLPMEFGAYAEAIIPALFGGFTFCSIAIYSYITLATPEQDRVFRFGILAMFINATPFIGQPISGYLFQQLGYFWSFAMAVSFQIIAILYIIFFIKEIIPQPKVEEIEVATMDVPPPLPRHGPPALNGAENLAFEDIPLPKKHESADRIRHRGGGELTDAEPVKKSCLKEFFDPSLVMDCIKVPLVKRANRGRLMLNLLIVAYFLTVSPALAENDYWRPYTLKKFNWNGNYYSFYLTFSSAAALVGTFIGTAIFSKLFKFSDSMIGIMSALAVVCSRVVFAFAKDTATFYLGCVVEMFVSLRAIAIKAIGSSIVDDEELGKMYSIFSITEPIGQFMFPPILSQVYQNTVDTFPGAIFLFVEIFYIPNVFVFLLCYIVMRRIKRTQAKNAKKEIAQNNAARTNNAQNVQRGRSSNGHTNPDSEVTSL